MNIVNSSHFEIIDHTADWAIRVIGHDLADLFVQAALGMNSLMVTDLTAVPLTETRQLIFTAYDVEDLLVDWLTELAYWTEMEHLVFSQFHIESISNQQLKASVQGGLASELVKHIKAVTYHNLAVVETAYGLEVIIVFDV